MPFVGVSYLSQLVHDSPRPVEHCATDGTRLRPGDCQFCQPAPVAELSTPSPRVSILLVNLSQSQSGQGHARSSGANSPCNENIDSAPSFRLCPSCPV
eukprot:331822-Rhodomonas_salina.3